MAALTVDTAAPDFTLQTVDGKNFSLQEALGRGPVMLAFFKVSCPTCQYTFPFLERLYKAYGNKASTLVAVSQNNRKDTQAFLRQFGITFPVLLDDLDRYPVSNAYGLTNVPTLFWIAQDGTIEVSSVGWVREEFDTLNRLKAESESVSPSALYQSAENVADFRAG